MDHINETTMSAFVDEMEKIGGIGSFLTKGIKGWGRVGRRSLSEHGKILKNIAKKGYEKGGVWEAAKRLGRTRYAPMAATAGTGALAAYGGYKALTGDDKRRY